MKFSPTLFRAFGFLCGFCFCSGFAKDSGKTVSGTVTLGEHDKSGTLAGNLVDGKTPASLVKSGSGTILVAGQSTFSGGTTVNGGILCLRNPPPGAATQKALGSGQVTINNGAIFCIGDPSKPTTGSYDIPNYFQVNMGMIRLVTGNPHFTGQVTIGPGGTTFITHSKGNDMSFEADITGAGPLAIDNDSHGSGGEVRFNNDFSLMGTVKINSPSPGFSGGRICLGDKDALNEATLIPIAGMRGIDFAPDVKVFSLGGLAGNANIDLKGKVLRVGVANSNLVYSGTFSDSAGGGGLIKSGSGTWTLTEAQPSHASMSVYYGTLVIRNAVAAEIKVGDPRIPLTRAMLRGTGPVGGVLLQTPGAIVQPGIGSATGILATRNFSMIPGSTLSIRLGGEDARSYDQIRATGQFSLYGNLDVSLVAGFQPRPGDVFYIMTTSGTAPVLGRFSNLVSNELTVGSHRFRINYTADSVKNDPASSTGHDVALIRVDQGPTGE